MSCKSQLKNSKAQRGKNLCSSTYLLPRVIVLFKQQEMTDYAAVLINGHLGCVARHEVKPMQTRNTLITRSSES